MNGIIGGTSLLDSHIFSGWEERSLETPFGPATVKIQGNWVFVQRHGSPPLPPHRINHRANIGALRLLGVTRILAINSVGSLKLKIRPGTFVIPDDFISPWQIPTFYDEEMRFMVPEMDIELRDYLFDLCRGLCLPVLKGGTYIQTIGPRLETRAEIKMLQRFGDVVGMTMASEATLCMEHGVPYVSLCSLDNYCNGIAASPLSMAQIHEYARKNMKSFELVIHTLLKKGF
jgi:5'-methylthioadenosine phosphorylase